MKSPTINHQAGFTLIEMIVSLAVFLVVITISVGALLMLIGTNEQLQAEQSVMTNLSFALDSMTREIRTGSHYYCVTAANASNNVFDPTENLDTELLNNDSSQKTDNCNQGTHVGGGSGSLFQGIAFVEGGNSITGTTNGRILYYFHNDSDDSKKRLYRRVGTSAPQPITSSGIIIEKAEFYVTGSKPFSQGNPNHEDQATVTIFIEARDAGDTSLIPKSYRLQTTVTQRALDI